MRSFNGVLPSSHPPNHGWTASRPPSRPQLPSWTNLHLSLKCLLNWVTKSRSQPSINDYLVNRMCDDITARCQRPEPSCLFHGCAAHVFALSRQQGTGRHRLRPACPTQWANTSSTNNHPTNFRHLSLSAPSLPSRLAVVRDPRGGSRHVTRAAKGQCCTPYYRLPLWKPKPTSRN